MNEFKRVRGLAIVSGLLFIVFSISDYWNFYKYINEWFEYNTASAIANIICGIIPLIVLGVMLIVGRMHYGLIVPPILYAFYYIVSIIVDMSDGYITIALKNLYVYMSYMLPWIAMAFILILCNKSLKNSKDSSIGIIGFVPAVVFLLVSFIARFGFRTYYDVEEMLYGIGMFLFNTFICFAAMIFMGLWIYINIKSAAQSGVEYKNAPNQQTGQAYYRQDQGYPNSYYRQNPNGAPQQPGQGAYQSYDQHFNGQSGAQQAGGQTNTGAQQTGTAQQAAGQTNAGSQQAAGAAQANAQRPNGQPGQQNTQQQAYGQYGQQPGQQQYYQQYNGAYNQQYAYQQYNQPYNQAYNQQYTHMPNNKPQGQSFTHQPNGAQGNFQQGQSNYQGSFQQGPGYYQGNFQQGQQYYQQGAYQQGGYPQGQQPGQQYNNMSDADKIKAFKELLDNGTITQEEFEQKKKQILGI